MSEQPNLSAGPGKRPSRLFGRYVIKNRFQFKFTLIVFAFLAAASLTIWVIGKLAVAKLIESGMIADPLSVQALELMNQIVGLTSLLAMAIVFGLSIFFSHFIAGPIYRFEKIFEEMRGGNLNIHVRLRRRDEFKETADLFNQALSSLRHRLQKERDGLAAAVNTMTLMAEDLKKSGHAQSAQDLRQLADDIKKIPSEIKI